MCSSYLKHVCLYVHVHVYVVIERYSTFRGVCGGGGICSPLETLHWGDFLNEPLRI